MHFTGGVKVGSPIESALLCNFQESQFKMTVATDQIDKQILLNLFEKQRIQAAELRKESVSARKKRLVKLRNWLLAHKEDLQREVNNDFQKPQLEVTTSELFPVLAEINHALSHLDEWTAPKKIDAPITYLGTRAEIRLEPKGTCLIIAPWNYPFNLCIGPLVSCLAAGNNAILKPSELTPHTSAFIRKMISEIFPEEMVAVVEGGADASSSLLQLPFDHIFFTGSSAVGKIVMKAAAENLASVTLELGGKSPAIVDETANLKDAAKRLAFGKFLNKGQTCIAPDYLLIHESKKDHFLALFKSQIHELFGSGEKINELSPDYARIVNQKHFHRLDELVQDAVQRGAKLELSGQGNVQSRFFYPTILTDVPMDSKIMDEEIFGPVLPVITFTKIEEAINSINKKPKPLSMYLFSNSNKVREKIIAETSAGSVCMNDCILQFTHPNLPFGGVNNSGMGKAHGYHGFMAFSNEKPVIKQKKGFVNSYFFYPPYTSAREKLIKFLLKWLV